MTAPSVRPALPPAGDPADEVIRSWPGRRADRLSVFAAMLALALVTAVPLVTGQLHRDWRNNFLDLDVYRSAVAAVGSGPDVYSQSLTWAHLPFTYPPFALLALAWLGFLPFHAAGIVAMLGSLALLAASCAVLVRVVLTPRIRAANPGLAPVLAIGLTALAIEFEPVRSTIGFGQINLVLMALVVLDAFVMPARYRGILTGLATAVKLTPAIFLIYHLHTSGWRAAARQTGTAVAVTLATAVVLPHESWRYWTSLVFTNRAGPTVFTSNQSWTGLVDRLAGGGTAPTVAILVLDGITVIAAAAGVHRLVASGSHLSALGSTAIAGLLISPISWSHHWVWAVVLVAGLALENPFGGARMTATGLALLFYTGPQWRVPYDNGLERHWTWWQAIAGNGYTLAAAAVLAISALGAVRSAPPCSTSGQASSSPTPVQPAVDP